MDRSSENEEVLLRVKEERNILHTVKRRLSGLVTSCLKLPSETLLRKGRGDGNRRKKCKLLLDDLKETVREEVLARILWTVRFGRGYRLIIRQNDDTQSFGVMQEVSQTSLITFTKLGKGRSCRILNIFRSPLRRSSSSGSSISRAVITDVDRNVKL